MLSVYKLNLFSISNSLILINSLFKFSIHFFYIFVAVEHDSIINTQTVDSKISGREICHCTKAAQRGVLEEC